MREIERREFGKDDFNVQAIAVTTREQSAARQMAAVTGHVVEDIARRIVVAPASIALIHQGELRSAERNLIKLVEFAGGTVTLHEAGKFTLPEDSRCVLASTQALSSLSDRAALIASAKSLLVYGFGTDAADGKLAAELSSGSVRGTVSVPAGEVAISVSDRARDLSRELSGLNFAWTAPERQWTFTGAGAADTMVSIAGKACFVRLNDKDSELMLLTGEIPDLDAVVGKDESVLPFFPVLAPLLMFLRKNFPSELWHNNAPRACLIIDDPLLKRRYGFLNFAKLKACMERRRFAASIAFIPWNRRRSNGQVASLFAASEGKYSICVHGCDHTRGEFGINDVALLAGKARRALERMVEHRERFGVEFDDVMVFPQGIFSVAAMKALDAAGYLAAINSTLYSVDGQADVRLRDLLQVSVSRLSVVPLFARRYPRQLAELAFDLFLGKPAFVVEHHGFFRQGYAPLMALVEKLQAIAPKLEWMNPAAIITQTSLTRRAENGTTHVRFFTDRFTLRNDAGRKQEYLLFRQLPSGVSEVKATVNGRACDSELINGELRLEIGLGIGETVNVKIHFPQSQSAISSWVGTPLYRGKVFIRRILSEFRDNYADPIRGLSRALRAR